ncbi:MAG: RIP metalloprotease RseP [Bacteriovoracales bacterium]|nr:RIP metalloprotease RseP [Bacteriovoracales bacterium]
MSALIFILFLTPLIFFHELGHFLIARYYGVRVEVFSVGFGPYIFKYKRGETVYAISLIPLGGYVKMLGDNILEKDKLPESERGRAFAFKSKWQRFWIVFGGPLANFMLAFVLFWALFISGETVPEPRIGIILQDSKFHTLGFRSGDILNNVNGQRIFSTFDLATLNEENISTISVSRGEEIIDIPVDMTKQEVFKEISSLFPPQRAPIVVDPYQQVWGLSLDPKEVDEKISLIQLAELAEKSEGEIYLVKAKEFTTKERTYDYSSVKTIRIDRGGTDEFFSSLMSQNYWPVDLMVKGITENSAAGKVGVQENDVIVALNEKKLTHFHQLIEYVGQMKKGESLMLKLYRSGELMELEVFPQVQEIDGRERNMIGVYTSMTLSPLKMVKTPSHGYFVSIWKALQRTWETTILTVQGFKELIFGDVPLKSVGGPIAIAKVAADSFSISLSHFLKIMAAISVNLAIINLFPIPVLDGGHILFIAIETITRRPISRGIIEASLKFGVSVIFVLIFMALYNDIVRYMNS